MSFSIEIPVLSSDANKYSRGKLTVVAGSDRYTGAAVLAARASQRMGAGYTEVITVKEAVNIVRLSSPSLVVRNVENWEPEGMLKSRIDRPCAVCVGPGFYGTSDEGALVQSILKAAECPVLIDGGALGCLTSKKSLKLLKKRAKAGFATVVTPHEGEAARIEKGLQIAFDTPDQRAAGLALALSSIVVLKGPDTFISDGNTNLVMTEGTAALAKAGTGDVLAGMISALLAQGIEPLHAAFTGATLHARAGIYASRLFADISVVAEDIINCISTVVKQQE